VEADRVNLKRRKVGRGEVPMQFLADRQMRSG
jgi:hypothetical protein